MWVHRLWQAGLRFISGYVVGFVFSRRLKISRPLVVGLFTAWTGLYLFQGPLFYNLVPIVILVLWLADPAPVLENHAGCGIGIGLCWPFEGKLGARWRDCSATLFYYGATSIGKKFSEILRYLVPPAVWTITGSLIGIGVITDLAAEFR